MKPSISATSVIRTVMIFGIFAFSSPTFSGTDEQTQPNNFGAQIAGTYLAMPQSADESTRILNLFADGNLTSIQSVQFRGEVPPNAFSNQHGTWKSTGDNKAEATVLSIVYDAATNAFLGTVKSRFDMQFDNTLQTVTVTVKGQVFGPGIDPLNPGSVQPTDEFSHNFQAKRVAVGSAGSTPGDTNTGTDSSN